MDVLAFLALFFGPGIAAILVGPLLASDRRPAARYLGFGLIAVGLIQVLLGVNWISQGCWGSWTPSCDEAGLGIVLELTWIGAAVGSVGGLLYGIVLWRRPSADAT